MSADKSHHRLWQLLIVTMLAFGLATPVQAVLVNNGGNGTIVFGVADYGGGPVAGTTYIPNNTTGINDVLTSPGGGFQTADTSIPNNIFQVGPLGTPMFGWKIGGFNANGNFGSGSVFISGPGVGFGISDANIDGAGAASYEIASWTNTYTNVGALNNITYGGFLAIAGQLSSPLSAAAVSLRVRIDDTAGLWNNFDMPELVLAASAANTVALGGPAGNNAIMNVNGLTGAFAGLAINNLGLVNIPDGDIITVTATLTVIADPADLSVMFDLDPQMILDTGATLPDWSSVEMTELPEPATVALLAPLVVLLRRRG